MRRQRWVGLACLAVICGACNDSTSLGTPVLGENPNPPESTVQNQTTVEVNIPDGLGTDASSGCETIECCEVTLGVESSPCAPVILTDGECEIATADDGSSCETDSLCTTGTCSDGDCVSTPTTCEASGPCVDSTCDTETGDCVESPKANGELCSDAPACIGTKICTDGACVEQAPVPCEDPSKEETCKSVSCDAVKGCVTVSTPGETCNDNNPCTVDDSCTEAGECTGNSVCECEEDADCKAFYQPCDAPLVCNEGACTPSAPPIDCDDNNECTIDKCDPVTGSCVYSNAASLCDDGNECTTQDTCVEGVCLGTAKDCDDGDPCTTGDSCDAATGACIPGTGSCPECTTAEDCPASEPCGGNWSCIDEKCVYDDSAAADCDALVVSSCQVASCDAESNTCIITELSDGTACDDNDICTTSETCSNGICQPGAFVSCDDENACTSDICNPTTGCLNNPLSGSSCDDGSACTTGDTCDGGECKPTAPLACDDGNQCTTNSCNPLTGCKFEPAVDASCDDNDACTSVDKCNAVGACVGYENTCECSNDTDCASAIDACLGTPVCVDGSCTVDTSTAIVCPTSSNPCAPLECSNGACAPVQKTGGECTDGSACTTGDTCLDGVCTGTDVTCDDSNSCTADFCKPDSGCTYINQLGECDDGNACTTGESCTASGDCAGGLPTDCEDNNLCTSDTCSPLTGCKYSDAFGGCNDGDKCTKQDFCTGGECVGVAIICNGGDGVCTTASCDPETGECAVAQEDCNDDNLCTQDACDPNVGCTNTAIDCTDDNLCTDDSCVPATGCVNKAKTCDDGLQCTTDSCNSADGECASEPVVCPVSSSCSIGECTESTGCTYTGACDDNNPCTEDTCVEDNGSPSCTNTAKDCDNDDPCTVGACNVTSGNCEQKPKDCDDENPCTSDSCGTAGCVNVELCDDSDPCTTDTCDEGLCSVEPLCDDGNPCTNDSCDNGTCSTEDIVCDDNIACTTDQCVDGDCSFTPADTDCDDDNPCTADSCSLTSGCVNTPDDDASCSDDNECTEDDTCDAGVCIPGEVVCGPCLGEAEGEECDDNDDDTTADICWQGTCAGFTTNIVTTGNGIPSGRFGKVIVTAGGFIAISTSETPTPASRLVRLNASGAQVEPNTTSNAIWVDITTDFVIAKDGTSLQYIDGEWSSDGWLPAAIQAFTVAKDISYNTAYWDGEGPAFIGGVLDGGGFVARCDATTGCGYENVNFDQANIEIPKAFGSWPSGPPGSELIMVTDIAAGGNNFWNDAFRRNQSNSWDFDFFDEGASTKRSRSVVGTAPDNAYWAGENGLLMYRDSDFEWSFKLDAINNQTNTDLNQAWAGGGIALLSASREHGNSKRTLYVVTHDVETNANNSGNWERHELYDQIPLECPFEVGCIDPFNDYQQPAGLEGVAASGNVIILTGWRLNPTLGTPEPMYFIR